MNRIINDLNRVLSFESQLVTDNNKLIKNLGSKNSINSVIFMNV